MSGKQPAQQTFLFADLAGFTALTEAHGDAQAADLVDQFCRQVRAALPAYDAQEVKTTGDGLMLRSPDAGQGVRLAAHLAMRVGGRHAFPAVRVGVHSGAAVRRGGDWFGATVNLASRVADLAAAGEALVTEATKQAAAPGLGQRDFRYVGERRLKNVKDPVRLYAALLASKPEPRRSALVIDPVCRMAVDRTRSGGERQRGGVEYRFCSQACAEAFDADPDHYHNQLGSGRPHGPGGPRRLNFARRRGGRDSPKGFTGLGRLLGRLRRGR